MVLSPATIAATTRPERNGLLGGQFRLRQKRQRAVKTGQGWALANQPL
jgi:hypothetical protein